MDSRYLIGVKREPSSFLGLEIISVGFDTWYAGPYNLVKSTGFNSSKIEIVRLVNHIKRRNTKVNEWDWHHVVETEHMAAFLFSCSLNQEKYFNMPTILIHEPEHIFFSQNFNNKVFRELATIPKGVINNFKLKDYGKKEERDELKTIIKNVQMMYNNMYINYPTLRKVANNVFNTHINLLG